MPVIDVVRALAPRGKAAYLKGFELYGDAQLAQAGINTPLRLAHFLARVMAETGDLSTLSENGNYSRKNLGDQWDKGNGRKQFASRAQMMSYAGNPQGLFNRWYGGRMGNGPASTGDGYRYRGRGPLQTTGKAAYAKYGKRIGIDLVANPDLLLQPPYILLPSLYEWQDGKCNVYADRDDALSVARLINVGTLNTQQRPNGYDDQLAALKRAKAAIAKVGWVPAPRPRESPLVEVPPIAGDKWADGAPSGDEALQIQLRLKALGYTEVGETRTGIWGPRSRTALNAFEWAEGLPVSADGIPVKATLDRLFDSRTGARPVSAERATATLQDIREDSPVLKQAQQAKGWAKLGIGGAGIYGVVEGVLSYIPGARSLLAPLTEMLGSVPEWVWGVAGGLIAYGAYRAATRIEVDKVQAYRVGADAGGT